MKIKQLMNKNLVTVPVNATIHDAALQMKKQNVGSILIVEDSGKLEGILTDRDIAMAVAADNKDPLTACAYDVMMSDPVIIEADASADAALRVMSTANVRRLPVCEDGKLVGLISSADLAAEIKEEINQFLELEEAFSKKPH
ncbi:MAG: CBS domain-containing protein [Nitrospiraceae bacterium]|nr:MAG: CBS domain-containing protein [Nitrospiraceae bacterium]